MHNEKLHYGSHTAESPKSQSLTPGPCTCLAAQIWPKAGVLCRVSMSTEEAVRPENAVQNIRDWSPVKICCMQKWQTLLVQQQNSSSLDTAACMIEAVLRVAPPELPGRASWAHGFLLTGPTIELTALIIMLLSDLFLCSRASLPRKAQTLSRPAFCRPSSR